MAESIQKSSECKLPAVPDIIFISSYIRMIYQKPL